jgi:hypothetical protein
MQQLLVGFMAVKDQSRNRRKSENGRVCYDHFFQVTVFLKEIATDDEALGPTIRPFIYGRCKIATSIYECPDCRLPSPGLHMLAHNCDHALRPKIHRPRFSVLGRMVIADIFQHLELGKETTALELNRKNDIFVWIECPRSPSFQNLVNWVRASKAGLALMRRF